MTQNRFIPLHTLIPGAIPTASALYQGELAINLADGKIYTRSGSNIVILNEFDTDNFVSSSNQILNLLNGSSLSAYLISASAFSGSLTGSVQAQELQIKSDISNIHLSASVVSGVYNETRTVNPPISVNNFSGVSIEYTAQRLSDIRSGIIIASWSGSTVTYTDVSNTDIGNTDDLSFNFIRVDDDIRLRVFSAGLGSGLWTIQFLFKLFPNLL